MAITKKALGNTGHYFETIKKWVKAPPECSEVKCVLTAEEIRKFFADKKEEPSNESKSENG